MASYVTSSSPRSTLVLSVLEVIQLVGPPLLLSNQLWKYIFKFQGSNLSNKATNDFFDRKYLWGPSSVAVA